MDVNNVNFDCSFTRLTNTSKYSENRNGKSQNLGFLDYKWYNANNITKV